MLTEESVHIVFYETNQELEETLRQVQVMMISLNSKGKGLMQISAVKTEVLQSCRKVKLLKHLLEILTCLGNRVCQ